jgi:hypothetical protein
VLVFEVPFGQLLAQCSPLTDPQAEVAEPSTKLSTLAFDKSERPITPKIAKARNNLK